MDTDIETITITDSSNPTAGYSPQSSNSTDTTNDPTLQDLARRPSMFLDNDFEYSDSSGSVHYLFSNSANEE